MVTLRLNAPSNIDICAVDFDAAEFRRALFQKGLRLYWDWIATCPCQKQVTAVHQEVLISEHRLECSACAGSGVIYANRHETYGMLLDSTSDVKWANLFARYADGSVLITLLPEHLPALGDRLTLRDGVCVYEEVFTHKAATERPRFPIVKRPMWVRTEDGEDVEEISVGVLYCRSAGTDGVIADTVYEEGTDFTVNDDGELVWITELEDGVRVAIRYFARPVFVVRGFPHTRRDLFLNNTPDLEDRFLVQHPVRVICEPEFLGARNPPVTDDVTGSHTDTYDPNLP